MSRLATSLLLLLTVLIGLEAATRIEDSVRFGDSLLSRFNTQADLAIRTSDGMHGRPNAQFEKWSINNLGFRGPNADSTKPAGRIRVIVSGASEAFGLYESPDHEMPRQLEDSLRARLRVRGCESEVWNAAFSGMAVPTIAQDVRLRLKRFAPDYVVLYATPAFYLEHSVPVAATPGSEVEGQPPPFTDAFRPRAWERIRSEGKSLVPEFVATWWREYRVGRAERSRGSEWRYRELPADRIDLFESDVRDVVGAIRSIGATPILATHGNTFGFGTARKDDPSLLIAWERFHPRPTGKVLIGFDSAARTRLYRIAGDSLPVADVATGLAASKEPPFQDYAHFNDHGAGVAAGVIAESIARAVAARGGCR